MTYSLTMASRRPGEILHHRFQVVRPLGRGGMASTFEVQDSLSQRTLALKLVHANNDDLLHALHNEFSVLRELHHPNLLAVHDFGRLDSACYYTSELITGATLDNFARKGSWRSVRPAVLGLLHALECLHHAQFRHGDVKPDNLLVQANGTAVLLDLGCATRLGAPPRGRVSGTRDFIAPELLEGFQGDERSDLFSVGITLQRSLEGMKGTIPAKVRRTIDRLAAAEPAMRPGSVSEVLEALGERSFRSPPAWISSTIVGRTAALSLVRRALDALPSGHSRVLRVQGPDGIGRTRLLREVTWLAQQRMRTIAVDATHTAPISRLLGAVLDEPPRSATDLLTTLPTTRLQEPCVLVVDDAHRLERDQQDLLRAFVRGLPHDSRVLVVASADGGMEAFCPQEQRVELTSLTVEEMRGWVGQRLSESAVKALHRVSNGTPSVAAALLRSWGEPARVEQALAAGQSTLDASQHLLQLLDRFPDSTRRTLALLATTDSPISDEDGHALGLGAADWLTLANAGVAKREIDGWRLVRHAHAASWLKALGEQATRTAHGDWANVLKGSDFRSRRVEHLARAGSVDEAKELLLKAASEFIEEPHGWLKAARAVADAAADAAVIRITVRLEREAGFLSEAYARARAWNHRTTTYDSAFALELATCATRCGELDFAATALTQLLANAGGESFESDAEHLLAHVSLKRARYGEALDHAQRAQKCATTATQRVDAQETQGLALSFLGDNDEALRHMREAERQLASMDDPRRGSRVRSCKAMVAYALGRLKEARRDYAEALRLAEHSGLADQIATAWLNLGTVCHQQGSWGEALDAYERAARAAQVLAQLGTESWAQFNLAKLYADVGAFERAQETVAACKDLIERSGTEALGPACDTVLGEVALARGDVDEAKARFASALRAFERDGSVREEAEVRLHLAEVALKTGAYEEALGGIETASALVDSSGARDVGWKLAILHSRWLLGCDRVSDAIERLEPTLEALRKAEQRDAEAEVHALLSEAWTAQGSPALAQRHSMQAQVTWERAAATLPPAMRDACRHHPRRMLLSTPPASRAAAKARGRSGAAAGEHDLARIFDLARWINSSFDTQQVLERAMDAAIELTGAERGFVLLASGPGSRKLRPTVARNVDREQLGKSHSKFSRSIAERVIRSGEPIVTADARADDRFRAGKSVHAMHLRSVLCVPVRSPEGVLGALYVDNRFLQGKFDDRDIGWLSAFADHVAIALTNARLHATLEQRNRELEHERERVEALMQGQAEQIDRLSEQVRRSAGNRAQKHAYTGIVGTSPAMRRVFDLLDRVIDTELAVLVRGESGTGKELVARAIHTYGPRSTGPLVAINCGALPDSLLESELFGYERGAFTGADRAREGLVVRAGGGILFLDEIGEMSPSTQVKLLRVLQEKEVRPLGARKAVEVDFRLVCATNRNLSNEVQRGQFREDLYYRIAAVEVLVPALRERGDDLRALVSHVLGGVERQTGQSITMTGQAMRKVLDYDWPGNVRQLENVLTRAAVVANEGQIKAADIDLPASTPQAQPRKTRADYQREEGGRIADALEANRWNVARTARALGIPRATVYRRMRQFGLIAKE